MTSLGNRSIAHFPATTDIMAFMTDTLDRVSKAPSAKAVALGEELPIFLGIGVGLRLEKPLDFRLHVIY